MTYDQLVTIGLELLGQIRQHAFVELGQLPPEELEAALKKLDDFGLGYGATRFPFPF